MNKRYTVTFDPKLASIAEPLQKIKDMGVEIQSSQPSIGTAIVSATSDQADRVRAMDVIHGVTETTMFKAI